MWNEGTREGFLEKGASLQALGAKWEGWRPVGGAPWVPGRGICVE